MKSYCNFKVRSLTIIFQENIWFTKRLKDFGAKRINFQFHGIPYTRTRASKIKTSDPNFFFGLLQLK